MGLDQSSVNSTLAISVFTGRRYSTKGVPRLSSADRALIIMPDEIKEILVGILQGDALVRKIVYGFSIFLVFFTSYFLDLYSYFYSYSTVDLYYSLVLPVLIYSNPKSDKSKILSENKGKPGIYLWKNKKNGKKYVGSSVNLANRLRNYFNTSYLSDSKDIMLIYKALLAYGFDGFTLEILEYCEPSDLIKREQYYINLLKPEYNILKIAGSVLGVKRSEETKVKLRMAALSRTEEALIKNKEHLKRLNSSEKQKKHLANLNASLEHIAITAKPVVGLDTITGETIEFRSMTQAAKHFSVHTESIRRDIKANKLLLNKYKIIKKD